MKKKYKKTMLVLLSLAIVSVTMTYQYFKNEQIKLAKKIVKNEKKLTIQKDQIAKTNSKEVNESKADRKIASFNPLKTHNDRIVVGNIDPQNKFPIANHINKDWKKLATKRLQDFVPKPSTFAIEPVKSAIFVKHQIGRYVEHVIIEIKKPDGLTSSFDAYIDSQSGAVIQTWNRTKFEIRPDYKLEAHGHDFESEPLNFDPQS